MYFWANEVVTTLGFTESVLLLLTTLISLFYTATTWFGRVPGRPEMAVASLPFLVAILLSYRSSADLADTIGFMQQQNALTGAQKELMQTLTRDRVTNALILGALLSVLLVAGLRSYFIPRGKRLAQQASRASLESAGAGKEEHAEPV